MIELWWNAMQVLFIVGVLTAASGACAYAHAHLRASHRHPDAELIARLEAELLDGYDAYSPAIQIDTVDSAYYVVAIKGEKRYHVYADGRHIYVGSGLADISFDNVWPSP